MSFHQSTSVVYLLLCIFLEARASVLPHHHPLYHSLHHFEPLHKDSIRHVTHRDSMPRMTDNLREVMFHTMGRHFRLFLSPSHRSFHQHIDSFTSDANGVRQRVPIQFHQFVEGHVFGEERSHVTAHVTDEGVVTAIIDLNHETYFIEPSYRHIKESHNFHMIVYKASDVKYNFTSNGHAGGKFCDSHKSFPDILREQDAEKNSKEEGDDQVRGRLKRQTSNTDRVCSVRLLTTRSFDNTFNGGSVDAATNYLLVLLSRIDNIYTNTMFHIPGLAGSAPEGRYGLQVEMVNLLDSFDTSDRSSDQILDELAAMNLGGPCLAHLFSGDSFNDGRLGLAYISSAQPGSPGGICSPVLRNFNGNPFFSGHTGITTIMSGNRLLLMAEAIQVTAHEFGHNWGSFHDPNTVECNPSTAAGKYLMYEFAQSGIAPNNMLFSNCSVRAITRVLNSKSNCFTARTRTVCGNYQVEANLGEQCDVGPNREDKCCNSMCRFKDESFECSDVNHACCNNCTIVPTSEGRVCDLVAPNNMLCRGNITCSGDKECPSNPTFAPVNTSCGVDGTCQASSSGIVCRDVCFRQDPPMVLCYCRGDDECKVCCQPNSTANSLCSPINGGSTNLPDGSFCEGGTCQSDEDGSRCVESNPDFSTFVFRIIANFDVNAFFQLVRENIVGTILFLTLLIWVPVSLVVHILVDVKRIFAKRARARKQATATDNDSSEDEAAPLMTKADSTDGLEINPDANPEYHPITSHIRK